MKKNFIKPLYQAVSTALFIFLSLDTSATTRQLPGPIQIINEYNQFIQKEQVIEEKKDEEDNESIDCFSNPSFCTSDSSPAKPLPAVCPKWSLSVAGLTQEIENFYDHLGLEIQSFETALYTELLSEKVNFVPPPTINEYDILNLLGFIPIAAPVVRNGYRFITFKNLSTILTNQHNIGPASPNAHYAPYFTELRNLILLQKQEINSTQFESYLSCRLAKTWDKSCDEFHLGATIQGDLACIAHSPEASQERIITDTEIKMGEFARKFIVFLNGTDEKSKPSFKLVGKRTEVIDQISYERSIDEIKNRLADWLNLLFEQQDVSRIYGTQSSSASFSVDVIGSNFIKCQILRGNLTSNSMGLNEWMEGRENISLHKLAAINVQVELEDQKDFFSRYSDDGNPYSCKFELEWRVEGYGQINFKKCRPINSLLTSSHLSDKQKTEISQWLSKQLVERVSLQRNNSEHFAYYFYNYFFPNSKAGNQGNQTSCQIK